LLNLAKLKVVAEKLQMRAFVNLANNPAEKIDRVQLNAATISAGETIEFNSFREILFAPIRSTFIPNEMSSRFSQLASITRFRIWEIKLFSGLKRIIKVCAKVVITSKPESSTRKFAEVRN
jgi:hypothetical protein